MRFSEFNQEVNPNDENCYDVEGTDGLIRGLSFNETVKLCNTDPMAKVGWRIPKGYYAVIFEGEELAEAVKQRNSRVYILQNKNTFTVVCRGTYAKTTVNNILACGISAETKAHSRDGNCIWLPFKNPRMNVNESIRDLREYHSNGIKEAPIELTPLRKESADISEGIQFPINSNAASIIRNQLKNLVRFSIQEKEKIVEFINDNFCSSPLTKDEIKKIMEVDEYNLLSQFMDGSEFFHDKLGNYVIESLNIKKDIVSNDLYFYNKKTNVYVNDENYIMGYMTRLLPRLKQYQKEETKNYIQNYLYEDRVEFNANKYSVVFKNGVYDMTTGSFEPMSPDNLESIMINANYDPTARSATADEFFETATCNDKDVENLLYEAIGYTMLKTNELAKFFLLTGSGRNGKSTYFDIIKSVLGKENYTSISLKDLSSNFRLAGLKGKLASLAGDISGQPIQDTDLLKSITAYEDITIEEKYKQAYCDKVFSTMLFACNKIPRTPDTSDGFYRRSVIIPFNADLRKISNVDGLRFHAKLLEQESLDYIAYKSLKAIENVMNNTKEFTQPDCVTKALNQYKIDSSSVLSWFRDTYKMDKEKLKNSNKKINDLFPNYKNWCMESNRNACSKQNFKLSIEVDIGIELD